MSPQISLGRQVHYTLSIADASAINKRRRDFQTHREVAGERSWAWPDRV